MGEAGGAGRATGNDSLVADWNVVHPFLQPTLAVGPFLINYCSSAELVEQLVSVALKPPSICLLSVGLFVFCPSVRIPVIVTTPSTVTMIIC